MSARDRYHDAVRVALEKEGWIITHDPLTLRWRQDSVQADLGAERLIAAERGVEKIAVEIKTFGSASQIADLERAIGQYALYEDVLAAIEPDRHLVLAVPAKAFNSVFQRDLGQLAVQKRFKHLVVYEPHQQEIVQWLP